VILGESLTTQSLLDTRPLPGRFVTALVDYNFLIIALIVKMGII